ncbi:MAG: ABC transporter permease [Thaumarchaeota archaeon]|nr:ABC transporter permease [Nitrososphaerota archaeon]
MNTAINFAYKALTIAEMEARKIRHDSSELWMRAIQPALWLVVFGSTMSAIRGLTDDNYSYLQFLTAGALAQAVMFVAILYGVRVIWERDVGMLTKLLSTPAPRSAIVIGKTLAAGVRGVFLAIVVFALTLILGINLRFDIVDVFGVLSVVVLFAMCFSSLSITLASMLGTQERMLGLGQAITMPLFFASNAIYPISFMPIWLQYISKANPLTYVVDAIRSMLLTGDYSQLPVDMLAIGISTALFMTTASITLRKLVR